MPGSDWLHHLHGNVERGVNLFVHWLRRAGLNSVSEIEPVLARCGSETAEGTEDFLPRTFGGAYGFDETIVIVAFALMSFGGLANVHRTLHTLSCPPITIGMLIIIRHYLRLSPTLC